MRIKPLFGPIIIFVLYLIFAIFIQSKIPDTATFIKAVKGFYETYGYFLIFFGALLEAILFISFYVPGSTVVLLGVALARTGVVSYPLVFIPGMSGLLSGYTVNYFLGRYGWYQIFVFLGLNKGIDTAKSRLGKYEKKTIFIGYIFPGSASFLSTAAGVLRMPFKKFFIASFLAQGFWSLIWGNLAYFFGLTAIYLLIKYFGIVILVIGVVWITKRLLAKKKQKLNTV